MQTLTAPTYSPVHLARWKHPECYVGATWEGYFRAPVGRTRDSDILTESNWEQQWQALKPLAEDVPDADETSPVQVQENHWAVGWVEWVAIHESNAAALQAADALAEQLEQYPVLNEDDWSNREQDEYLRQWQDYAARDFRRGLVKEFALCDAVDTHLDAVPWEPLLEFFESLIPSGEFHHDGCPCVSYAVKECTRDNLAVFLKSTRKNA